MPIGKCINIFNLSKNMSTLYGIALQMINSKKYAVNTLTQSIIRVMKECTLLNQEKDSQKYGIYDDRLLAKKNTECVFITNCFRPRLSS